MYLCELGSRASNEWHRPLRFSDGYLCILGCDKVLVIDAFHGVRSPFSEALKLVSVVLQPLDRWYQIPDIFAIR